VIAMLECTQEEVGLQENHPLLEPGHPWIGLLPNRMCHKMPREQLPKQAT
jgi:hypothetical protein